jgi:uncharacterized protein YcsI (UPF0317 family)
MAASLSWLESITYASKANGEGPFNCTPVGSFDSNVRSLRIVPAGQMQRATSVTSQHSFTIRFRAQVE